MVVKSYGRWEIILLIEFIIQNERCTAKGEVLTLCLCYILQRVKSILAIRFHQTEGDVHCERWGTHPLLVVTSYRRIWTQGIEFIIQKEKCKWKLRYSPSACGYILLRVKISRELCSSYKRELHGERWSNHTLMVVKSYGTWVDHTVDWVHHTEWEVHCKRWGTHILLMLHPTEGEEHPGELISSNWRRCAL